jgi:hypothetical protein
MIVLETGCFWNFWGFGAFLFFPLLVSCCVLSRFFCLSTFLSFLLLFPFSFAAGARERVGGGSFDICVAEEEEEEEEEDDDGEKRTCLRIFG